MGESFGIFESWECCVGFKPTQFPFSIEGWTFPYLGVVSIKSTHLLIPWLNTYVLSIMFIIDCEVIN